jgi:cytoskeletal protein CcmA (bactofilin family)
VWRKQDEPKPPSPVAEVPPPPRVEPVRSVAGLTAEVVQPSGGMIMSSLVIKGEIRGREDLYIDGEVQGTINLSEGRVTLGPHGRISADIEAREIVVRGTVEGTLLGRERVEIGRTGDARGDIVTARIAVEDGARIHGHVDVPRTEESRWDRSQTKALDTPSAEPLTLEPAGD